MLAIQTAKTVSFLLFPSLQFPNLSLESQAVIKITIAQMDTWIKIMHLFKNYSPVIYNDDKTDVMSFITVFIKQLDFLYGNICFPIAKTPEISLQLLLLVQIRHF